MVIQLVDTTISITIAFYGTMPLAALAAMILTQYLFKWVVAAADTPLVYLLVKLARRSKTATQKSFA